MAGNFTAATGADFHYRGTTDGGAPSTGQFVLGDWVETPTGIALCRIGGTPGTWSDFSFTPTGATVPTLPASNGVDDTAVLNAALLANAGKYIRGKPGETYKTTAPLVVYSGTTVDMTGCAVSLIGSAGPGVRNFAADNPNRTVADAAITAGSANLVIASAAAADVGRSVNVAGAGPLGRVLTATVLSRSGTTLVLDTAATTTVAGASCPIYDRDSDIAIFGGSWSRDASVSNDHFFRPRFVDGLVIRDLKVSTSHGKFAISLGACTEVLVSNIRGNTYSDLCHLQGPAKRVRIENLTGHSGDDFCAIVPNDYIAVADIVGDVIDVQISGLFSRNAGATSSTCKVNSGNGIVVKNITVDGVHGEAGLYPVWVGDDPNDAGTQGGRIDGVKIANVDCAPNVAGYNNVTLRGTNIGKVVIDGVVRNGTVDPGVSVDVLVGSVVDVLTLLNFREVSTTGGSRRHVVNVAGTVSDLIYKGGDGLLDNGYHPVHIDATGVVTRLTLEDLHHNHTGGSMVQVAAGGVLTRCTIVACTQAGTPAYIADLVGTTDLQLSGNWFDAATGLVKLGAAAIVTVRGNSNRYNSTAVTIAAGGSLIVKSFEFPADLTATGVTSLFTGVKSPRLVIPPSAVLAASAGAVWYTANAATFLRFSIPTTETYQYINLYVDTSSGNIQVGVVRLAPNTATSMFSTRVMDSGIIACPGSAAAARIDCGATVTPPGDYGLFLWCDNTTAKFLHGLQTGMAASRMMFSTTGLATGVGAGNNLLNLGVTTRWVSGLTLEAAA